MENYTLPVYSYYLGCVKCEDYRYRWVKFIVAAFLPLTLFYIMVIVFRISATSSALNGYVLISQLVANPTTIQMLYFSNGLNPYYYPSKDQFYIGLYIAIWNLDFFRSFYKPICLYPDLRYQQVLLLDYAVAVYPLLLIFITFICVKLHDNFAIVVLFWSPFHKCLVRFRKQWNIRSYLINALATFIVLSYVKILNVSFEFLIASNVYNMEGRRINKAFWYYDGRVDMTSKEYLPYLVFALCMLLIFNILPLVLLKLYPFRCFQICLNRVPSSKFKLALQIFMDTFHGCYKDGRCYDCRHFAALYLGVRFLNHLFVSIFRNQNAYVMSESLILVFVLALVAKFQPYKCKRSNTVDIVMLLSFITAYVSGNMENIGQLYPSQLIITVETVAAIIPPCYAFYLLLSQILLTAVQCFKRFKECVVKRMDKFEVKLDVKDQPLLNHEIAE